jgi:uncharacterized membrane protein
MLRRTTEDNSPPLYYVMLHGWIAIWGDSVVAIRSLSVLCSVVAVVAVSGFASCLNQLAANAPAHDRVPFHDPLAQGRAIGGAISPVITAGLMAASPLQIELGTEARPYALGVLLAVLSTWAFIRIEHATGTWRTALGYWGATTLFVYTHHFAWFVVAGQALCAIRSALSQVGWTLAEIWSVRAARQIAVAIMGVVLVYTLWLPALLRQTAQVSQEFWLPLPSGLLFFAVVYRMFVLPSITIAVNRIDELTVGFLFVAAMACFAWRARIVDRLIILLIVTAVGLPFIFWFFVTFSG